MGKLDGKTVYRFGYYMDVDPFKEPIRYKPAKVSIGIETLPRGYTRRACEE